MNLSGILVVAAPGHVDSVLARLAALDGVEVRQHDRASGRIVVVQEAADVGAEVAGFGRIRALPHVLAADLVCHYFGEAGDALAHPAIATLLHGRQAGVLPPAGGDEQP